MTSQGPRLLCGLAVVFVSAEAMSASAAEFIYNRRSCQGSALAFATALGMYSTAHSAGIVGVGPGSLANVGVMLVAAASTVHVIRLNLERFCGTVLNSGNLMAVWVASVLTASMAVLATIRVLPAIAYAWGLSLWSTFGCLVFPALYTFITTDRSVRCNAELNGVAGPDMHRLEWALAMSLLFPMIRAMPLLMFLLKLPVFVSLDAFRIYGFFFMLAMVCAEAATFAVAAAFSDVFAARIVRFCLPPELLQEEPGSAR